MFKNFTEKPDIIILDYRMPIKNGIDALKEILQIDHNSRVIFASADKTIKEEVYSYGAMEFLDKPFTHQRLISTLNRCLKSVGIRNSWIKLYNHSSHDQNLLYTQSEFHRALGLEVRILGVN